MGGTEQTEKTYKIPPNQAVSRTGKGRFSVLLFQRAALFGRVQPQTERHQARPYRSDHRKDSGQPYHRVKQPQQGDTGKIQSVPFPEDDRGIPVVSNQKMNDYLKELGQLAKSDEPIRETYYKEMNE